MNWLNGACEFLQIAEKPQTKERKMLAQAIKNSVDCQTAIEQALINNLYTMIAEDDFMCKFVGKDRYIGSFIRLTQDLPEKSFADICNFALEYEEEPLWQM